MLLGAKVAGTDQSATSILLSYHRRTLTDLLVILKKSIIKKRAVGAKFKCRCVQAARPGVGKFKCRPISDEYSSHRHTLTGITPGGHPRVAGQTNRHTTVTIIPDKGISNTYQETSTRTAGDQHSGRPGDQLGGLLLSYDCEDRSDEGGFCGACKTYECEEECVESPLQPTCHCSAGKRLGADTKSCVDVDECDEGEAGCDHICENGRGSFECSCVSDHFRLADDKRTCELKKPNDGRLLVCHGNDVRSIPLQHDADGVNYEIMVRLNHVGALAQSIDYHSADQRLYIAMNAGPTGGWVYTGHDGVNDTARCLIEGLDGLQAIAVDWVTGNLYYALGSPSPVEGFGVCDKEGRFCQMLIHDSDTSRPSGLALHPKRGLMFYAYWSDGVPHIEAANMDGSHRQVLVSSKLQSPRGLTIDYVTEQLYWVDAELKMIERVHIITHKRELLTSKGVHHPTDAIVFDHRVFWADWNVFGVKYADLRNHDENHVVTSVADLPYGLAIDHAAYQDSTLKNPCSRASCSHLCLLRRDGESASYSCRCPIGYTPTDKNETYCVEHRVSNDNTSESAPFSVWSTSLLQPTMCKERREEMCASGTACLNGGGCGANYKGDGTKDILYRCNCPIGFDGRYCEIASGSVRQIRSLHSARGGGGDSAALIVGCSLLLLVAVVFITVYIRRNGVHNIKRRARDVMILPSSSLLSAPSVLFRKSGGGGDGSRRGGVSAVPTNSTSAEGERMLPNEQPPPGYDQCEGAESFANPIYEDIDKTSSPGPHTKLLGQTSADGGLCSQAKGILNKSGSQKSFDSGFDHSGSNSLVLI